jgi:hypothetical protein
VDWVPLCVFVPALVLFLGGLSIASTSRAQTQTTNVIPYPQLQLVDTNEVNLATGAPNVSDPALSIGQAGEGGLVYTKRWDNLTSGVSVLGGDGGWLASLWGNVTLSSGGASVFVDGRITSFALESDGCYSDL